MTCGNCGYRIPEDSEFCQYCGVRITGSPTPASAPSPAPARKNSAPKKPRRTAWVALLVLVLVLLGGLVWFWGIPGMKYMQAKDQLNNGDYDGAYAAFCALGNFADAPQQSLEARYQKAVALRAQGDFDDANPIFRELLDYRDSSALIHEHNYVMTVIKEATCTTAGEKRGVCDCGDATKETLQVPATGHNMELSSQTVSTCAVAGKRVYRCIVCGDTRTETLPKVAHRTTETVVKKATCTAEGKSEMRCSVCGTVTAMETTRATGHNYAAATCTQPKTCKTCGVTSGSALGHTDNLYCERCGTKTRFAELWESQGSGRTSSVPLSKGDYTLYVEYRGQKEVSVWYCDETLDEPSVVFQNEKGPFDLTFTLRIWNETENSYFKIETPMDNCLWQIYITEEK